jgi:hypothetical protein
VSNSVTESKSRPKPNPPLDSHRHRKSAVAPVSDAGFMRQALQHIAHMDLAGFVIAGERGHHEIVAATSRACVLAAAAQR